MKKRVLLKAPILTQSGYGEHSRFIYRALKSREDLFDLYIEPLNWGKTGWLWEDSEERRDIDLCVGKFYQVVQQKTPNAFDICVNVDLPTAWKRVAPLMIGVTAGIECDATSPTWLQPCFSQVDKIVVPSEFSKEGFLNSIEKYRDAFDQNTRNQLEMLNEQLKDKISVVHYPVKSFNETDLELQLETDFNFLLVAQWGPRKNIEKTIKTFYREFYKESDVGLIIKTNVARNSTPDRFLTNKKLQSIKEEFDGAKCKVYLIHGEMTNDEMHSLYVHPKVKAMINFGHGEGYGLPLFEAAYCGLPVITHDFGGQKDFLYAPKKAKNGSEKIRPHFTKVPYKLEPVQAGAVWQGVIEADAEWAFPNMSAAGTAMKEAHKNHGLLKSEAKRLKGWLEQEFEEGRKYNKFVEVVWGEKVFDYDSIDIADLPKISFITSVYKGGNFIEGFMEDITNQTIFKDKCELILVDCNSPDDEEAKIKQWQEKFPENIKYIKLDDDPGIYAAWNLAIKESTGEFISNANLDDRKSAHFAEKLGKFLYAHPDVDCVYTANLMTKVPHETFDDNSSSGSLYPAEEFSKQAMLRGNPPHCMPMWRKSLHEANGWFDENYRSAADWDFWLRCAYNDSVYKKLSEPLGLYYFNPNGMSTNKENRDWKRKEEKTIFKKYFDLQKAL